MEGYAIGLLKCVAVVVDRRKPGGDKGAGPVLPVGSIEGAGYGKLEGVGPEYGDNIGISKGT